jgi:multiple sugar transport system permease protein
MGKSRAHYWFIGPAVALMLLLLIMPVFVAATLSMTDYSLGNSSFNWVGIENYEKLFSRRSYQKMFSASLTLCFGGGADISCAWTWLCTVDFKPAHRR